MGDVIIYMSAYKATSYSKSKRFFKQKSQLKNLFEKHHIAYVINDDKLLSNKGTWALNTEYDYIRNKTTVSYNPINKKQDIEEYKTIIKNTSCYINLLHAQSALADPSYFKIDCFICMDSLLVYINDHTFQIDPIIFLMNGILIITFEIIDAETGISLKKDDVFGKKGNYNLLTIKGYQYFGEAAITLSNYKIPELIYNNISDLFSEMIGKRFSKEYSFVHNTLVLSNEIDDISRYFCNLINIREMLLPLENISTTENYQYYPQDGASVIIKYDPDDIDTVLYNGIMLESIKLYIYLSQIINEYTTIDINKVVRNDLYLESLFFAPNVPIETHNLLDYIHKTKSFRNHNEVIKLKIAYIAAKNESKKNKNALFLNFLLYIVSLLGAINSLETIESKLKIPFKYSFVVVIFIFLILGLILGVSECRRNKHF